MKLKKVGINTLAIVLIIIGVLFLLDNFYTFDIWRIVSIIWPLIIIIFGLELIITKTILSKKEEETRMAISGGSVILLIILVITLIIFSGIAKIDSDFFKGINLGDSIFNNYKYTSRFEKDYTIKKSDMEEIDLKNDFGNIQVKAKDVDDIIIKAKITVRNNDKDYAKEIVKNLITIEENNYNLKIKSNSRDFLNNQSIIKNVTTDFEVIVPKDMKTKINGEFGNIEILNLYSGVKIDNKHGNVYVENIKGDVSVENSFGDIDIRDIVGSIDLINKHGYISSNKISGDVKIENSFGNIDVYDVYNEINIENKSGNINLETDKIIKDNVYIKNKLGNIKLDILENQKGKFIVNTKLGSIDNNLGLNVTKETSTEFIDEIKGNDLINIDLSTSSGNINIR